MKINISMAQLENNLQVLAAKLIHNYSSWPSSTAHERHLVAQRTFQMVLLANVNHLIIVANLEYFLCKTIQLASLCSSCFFMCRLKFAFVQHIMATSWQLTHAHIHVHMRVSV